MAKFNHIREIDFDNRVAVVEAGVTNLAVTEAVAHKGFYYAPDPSSQIACTIGGNVAENSGGLHCLKYGMTTNNLLGCEIVLMSGEVLRIGGKHLDSQGYDLLGIITGSEGLLGVVTEVTVRILRRAETQRHGGRLPVIRRRRRLRVGDHRRRHHSRRHGDDGQAGDPRGRAIHPFRLSARRRGAADRRSRRHQRRSRPSDRARRGDREKTPRRLLPISQFRGATVVVLGRAQGGVSRGRPHLARLLLHGRYHPARETPRGAGAHQGAVGKDAGLPSPTCSMPATAHAPAIVYDFNKPGELERAEEFGADILRLCVEVGGVLTGEHGVGVEKRDLMPVMFTEIDLDAQQRVKCAFDEKGLLNPGKVFPKLHRCANSAARIFPAASCRSRIFRGFESGFAMTAGPKDKARATKSYRATPAELKAIDEALAAVERGEIATDEEVEAVFARYRRPSSLGLSGDPEFFRRRQAQKIGMAGTSRAMTDC